MTGTYHSDAEKSKRVPFDSLPLRSPSKLVDTINGYENAVEFSKLVSCARMNIADEL